MFSRISFEEMVSGDDGNCCRIEETPCKRVGAVSWFLFLGGKIGGTSFITDALSARLSSGV